MINFEVPSNLRRVRKMNITENNIWKRSQKLLKLIENHLSSPAAELDAQLRRNQSTILSVLKYPVSIYIFVCYLSNCFSSKNLQLIVQNLIELVKQYRLIQD